MFRHRLVRALGLLTLAVGPLSLAISQEPDPKPAVAVPAGVIQSSFRSFVVSDERFEKSSPRNRAERMHDLVIDNALNPVVAIFARQQPVTNGTPNADLAKLTARMNELVLDKELKAARLGSFVVFLTLGKEYPEAEGRDPATKDVRAFADAVKKLMKAGTPLAVPLCLAASKSDAVTAWGIGETDALTVVFYREMKTIQKWSFAADKPPTDEIIKGMTDVIERELRAKK